MDDRTFDEITTEQKKKFEEINEHYERELEKSRVEWIFKQERIIISFLYSFSVTFLLIVMLTKPINMLLPEIGVGLVALLITVAFHMNHIVKAKRKNKV